uniref:Runx3 MASN-variant n=1 Tax=Gallus gallus TaxID=9031 RepID=A8QJ83_CHICK|nr:Runx3 MASN-variant [Gallus gallus]
MASNGVFDSFAAYSSTFLRGRGARRRPRRDSGDGDGRERRELLRGSSATPPP